MKLRAAGTDVQEDGSPGAVPVLDASDPSLPTLLEAARLARPVTFDYLKPGSGTAQLRTIEPWGVLSWRKRWYVAGLDRDRGEPRSFRLSRISGPVKFIGPAAAFERPEKVDLLEMVAGGRTDEGRVARVKVTGPAASLRRMAQVDDDGVLSISFAETNWLARRIASAGSQAHVLEPEDLRDAVLVKLRAAAGDTTGEQS
jgi:predicted DNA-binding transcriptional regulator YafY